MQRPPLPKDDRARSSTADAAVGASERGADAQSVRDRSPLRHSHDVRAEWIVLQEHQEAIHASLQ